MMGWATSRETKDDSRFWLIFEQAAVGIALMSPKGHFLRANPELCRMLGYSEEELQNYTLNQLTHPEDESIGNDLWHRLLGGEIATYRAEKRYVRRDGHVVWALLSMSLLRDEAGVPMQAIAIMQDVTLRKIAQIELEEARKRLPQDKSLSGPQSSGQTDPLTGLLTKGAIDEIVTTRLASPRAASFPFGLLLVDIDNFAALNGTYGHIVGDEIIRRVAQVLKETCRDEDAVARCTGDQFLIMLPSTNPGGTIIVGEKLIGNVASIDWANTPLPGKITASIGASCVTLGAELTLEEVMDILNVQLAQAKEGGGGRLVMNTRQTAPRMGRY